MDINFHKYQGTGNDFIMIDDRLTKFPDTDLELVMKLCDRRFGIGADGLILLRNHSSLDFDMIYFNADGTQSLCGNGSRCAVRFANSAGICTGKTRFNTIEGELSARIKAGLVHLRMPDVKGIRNVGADLFINSGSPHYIRYITDIEHFDVYNEGRSIRYNGLYGERGTNVNFIESRGKNEIFVRTYERGVENETLSCGTGVTACAIAHATMGANSRVSVSTPGGKLTVSFKKHENGQFTDIFLVGPAEKVFEGKVTV